MKYKNKFIQLIDDNGKECEVIQVSRIKAKNAYDSNKTVWLHPCNMLINSVWQQPIPINKEALNTKYNDAPTFESIANQYIYYNCNNQLGKYPIFFIEK